MTCFIFHNLATPCNNSIIQRRGRNNLLDALKLEPRQHSPPKNQKSSDLVDEPSNVHARLRKKMRDKILNHTGGSNSSVGGGNASIFGNHIPSTTARGGGEQLLMIPASSTLSSNVDSLDTMSAILEACILGLYNTYVIAANLKNQQKDNSLPPQLEQRCTIPPISEGSVFSGKLPSTERCRLLLDCADKQTGQSLDGNLASPIELMRRSSLGSGSALPWERLSVLRSHQQEMNVHVSARSSKLIFPFFLKGSIALLYFESDSDKLVQN